MDSDKKFLDDTSKDEVLQILATLLLNFDSLKSFCEELDIKDCDGNIYSEIKSIKISIKKLIKRVECQ